jgi:hypothetical protein
MYLKRLMRHDLANALVLFLVHHTGPQLAMVLEAMTTNAQHALSTTQWDVVVGVAELVCQSLGVKRSDNENRHHVCA